MWLRQNMAISGLKNGNAMEILDDFGGSTTLQTPPFGMHDPRNRAGVTADIIEQVNGWETLWEKPGDIC